MVSELGLASKVLKDVFVNLLMAVSLREDLDK